MWLLQRDRLFGGIWVAIAIVMARGRRDCGRRVAGGCRAAAHAGRRGLGSSRSSRGRGRLSPTVTRASSVLSPADVLVSVRACGARRLRPRPCSRSVVPRWKAIWLALAALIAFSRVYIGVHYPLDVTCGALFGVADRRLGHRRTCMVYSGFVFCVPRRAEVAQLVEHTTENRGVGSSILPLGTINSLTNSRISSMFR